MRLQRDLPHYDSELATMPHNEYAARLAAAYRTKDKDEFLRLGQRLVWRLVVGKFSGDRLRPYREDMHAEGMIGLIEFFDGRRRRLPKNSYGYLRGVARNSIFTWLYAQHIIRRKRAKHPDLVANSEILAYVGRNDAMPEPPLAETIGLCLRTLAARCRAEKLRVEEFVLDRDESLARVGLFWRGHAG